jgi:hypothetical protein
MMPRSVKKAMHAMTMSMATVAHMGCPNMGIAQRGRQRHVEPCDVGEVSDLPLDIHQQHGSHALERAEATMDLFESMPTTAKATEKGASA